MRYGVELPCGGIGVTPDLLVQLGVRAELAGWDGVFFEDYLVYYRGDDPPTFDPWVLMGAIACRTDSVRLGSTVTGLLARDVAKLARDAVTVDHLSGGRAILGVGLGDPADRGARVDRPAAGGARGRLMDERLDLLLDLVSGRPVALPASTGGGQVTFRPAGTGAARLPVWVGGSSQAGAVMRRAARADGTVPYKLTDTGQWSDFTVAEVARMVGEIAEHRLPADGPFDVAIGGRKRHADSGAERAAIAAARAGGATWWLEFVHPGSPEEMLAGVSRGPLRV